MSASALAEDPIIFDDNLAALNARRQLDELGRAEGARGATRLSASVKAIACFSDNTYRHCVIRDLSTGGAKLEFLTGIAEETSFVLFIPTHNIALNCTRIWLRKLSVGVQFEHGRPDIAGLADAESAIGDVDQFLAA